MGGAFTAVCDDAAASWSNPAGLTNLSYKELSFFSRTLWETSNSNYFAYAHPTKKYGSFGVSIYTLDSSEFIKRETIFDSEGESFKISDNVYLFSYARKACGNLYAGLNFKIISKAVMDYRGTGVLLLLFSSSQLKAEKWGREYEIRVEQPGNRYGIPAGLIRALLS